MAEEMVRRRYIFRGRVQGVGFRATTYDVAINGPVAGFVRNLPDGSVELMAEGSVADVDALIETLRRRFGRNITGVEESTPQIQETLQGFEVRR